MFLFFCIIWYSSFWPLMLTNQMWICNSKVSILRWNIKLLPCVSICFWLLSSIVLAHSSCICFIRTEYGFCRARLSISNCGTCFIFAIPFSFWLCCLALAFLPIGSVIYKLSWSVIKNVFFSPHSCHLSLWNLDRSFMLSLFMALHIQTHE